MTTTPNTHAQRNPHLNIRLDANEWSCLLAALANAEKSLSPTLLPYAKPLLERIIGEAEAAAMGLVRRPLLTHTADGMPVYSALKYGEPLSCWIALDPLQDPNEEGGNDAVDIRDLTTFTGERSGMQDERLLRAAVEAVSSDELRQRTDATLKGAERLFA